jgi:hypothetical protein
MRRASAALLLAACAPALAQELDPLATRPGWELGLQGTRYDYTVPDVAKLSGNRVGALAALTFTDGSGLFSKLDFRGSYGRLKYETTGVETNVPDVILEARALAGLDWIGAIASLSPYLGLGYRYLYDDLQGYHQSNPSGYRRYSNYLYAPVGFTARLSLGGGWVLAPTAEADVFLYGTQVNKLSDIDVGLSDVTNRQDKGYGYRAWLMLEKDRWAFGAWTSYWHVKASDTVSGVSSNGVFFSTEPESTQRETGLEIRYRF